MKAILLLLLLAVSVPTLAQDALTDEDKAMLEELFKEDETLTPEEKAQRARDTSAKLEHHQHLLDTKQKIPFEREMEFHALGKELKFTEQVAFLHKLEEEGFSKTEIERLRRIAQASVPRHGKSGKLIGLIGMMTLKEKSGCAILLTLFFLFGTYGWIKHKFDELDHGTNQHSDEGKT